MKKYQIWRSLLCVCLLLLLAVSICSCEGSEDSNGNTVTYSVSVGGTAIAPDMEMTAILSAIKETPKISESSACPPFTGVEKLYEFSNLKLTTYSDGGKDRVMSIFLKDDSLSLNGVKIGSTLAEMEEALGKNHTQSGNGLYTYAAKDGAKLKCIMKGGAVVSIELVTAKADS